MKLLHLLLALGVLIMMGACSSKKVEKPIAKKVVHTKKQIALDLSKINYPNTIGDYELEYKKSLESKNLGIMIRYIDHKKTKAYLDCYIYPQKQPLQAHYQDNIAALQFMHKKGVLKRFNILSEDNVSLDATHNAKRAVFEMENQSTAYYSTFYLSPVEDHYFKVRLSHPHRDTFLSSDKGEKVVKTLFSKIKFNQ